MDSPNSRCSSVNHRETLDQWNRSFLTEVRFEGLLLTSVQWELVRQSEGKTYIQGRRRSQNLRRRSSSIVEVMI